ncbi:hypothetical protein BH23BAC2_BH23BAC2_03400 [soil metagenome]
MRILANPTRSDFYQIEFEYDVLRINFLLSQIDILNKDSLLFNRLRTFELQPIPLIEEDEIYFSARNLISKENMGLTIFCVQSRSFMPIKTWSVLPGDLGCYKDILCIFRSLFCSGFIVMSQLKFATDEYRD